MDFKDVKNNEDLKVFVDKAFEPICKNPEKLVEVLKKAWGDPGHSKGEDDSDTKSLRDLFPNYTHPPWDKIKYADFPPGSEENPFNPLSKGKYFIYLTNRSTPISYLGENFEDFKERDSKLSENVQKGYTDLWVFQRVFLITNENRQFQWEAELDRLDKSYDHKPFCLFSPYDLYSNWGTKSEQVRHEFFEKAKLYAKKYIKDSDYPILCGMRISRYYWH